MANLTPIDEFTEVYQLETTDQVVGGPGGKSNLQGQQLANRTLYLKNKVDALTAKTNVRKIVQVTGTDPYAVTAANWLLNQQINVSGDGDNQMQVTLPPIANMTAAHEGMSMRFKNCGGFDVGGNQSGFSVNVTVKCNAAEAVIASEGAVPGDAPMTQIDLAIGDMLELTVVKQGIDYFYFVTILLKKRADMDIQGVISLNDDSGENSLSVADLNKLMIWACPATDCTYVLPPLSDVPDNTRAKFMCFGTMVGNGVLKNNAADGGGSMVYNGSNTNSLINFSDPKHTMELLKFGNKWYVIHTNI